MEHDDLEAAAAPVPPVPPEVAHRVFGARLDLAVAYVEHLVTTGIEWGLVGPREAPRIWERHVLNCAVMADLVPEGATVADIGSGAGLPGLALAIRRPDLDVTLVEPLLRRTTWLEHVVADLDLEHVRVLRARAEELHETHQVQVVTARAVAPLDRLARWALPLLTPEGELLALKGAQAQDEVERTRAAVRRAGGAPAEVEHVGDDLPDGPSTVVRVRRRPGTVARSTK
ncbi:16S rRNA (guanine(527)-N(7))-methyltransferase RsmG [Angustibacter aerolatus]